MGYDVAYHTIHLDVLNKEIIPYILNAGEEKSIEDFLRRSYQVETNRFIAERIGIKAKEVLKDTKVKFDTYLFIYGRPFFVTEEDTDKMVSAIDQYMSADSPEKLEEIISAQLKNLGLSIAEVQLTEEDLKSKPTYEYIANETITLLNKVRKAILFLKKSENRGILNGVEEIILSFSEEEGDRLNMNFFLKRPFLLMAIIASATPAWMDRGLVNPSSLIEECKLEMPAYIKGPNYLLNDISKSLQFNSSDTTKSYHCNYDLGIVILPEDIDKFISFFKEHYSTFLNYLLGLEMDQEDATRILQKIYEALYYANKKQLAFIESTEVFSWFAERTT